MGNNDSNTVIPHILTPYHCFVITIQSLDPLYVVRMQFEVGAVPVVHGPHQRAVVLRVAQTQRMADLVGGNNPQVGTIGLPFCPHLILVEMHNARLRRISMSQNIT